MKLYVTYRALAFRKSERELFARGEYIPLRAAGACASHVCAFARRFGENWAVVVAPRWMSKVTEWGDTRVELPDHAPGDWRDVLTGARRTSLAMGELLSAFPVALLAA
jgi:(1->4)-alpha-D-glucan 1-alpha-D-glucosylmutase